MMLSFTTMAQDTSEGDMPDPQEETQSEPEQLEEPEQPSEPMEEEPMDY